jgi:hypothetical protein
MLITYSGGGNKPGRAICIGDHCHTLGWRFPPQDFGKIVVNDFDVSRINCA